jgi:hypothetical protein
MRAILSVLPFWQQKTKKRKLQLRTRKNYVFSRHDYEQDQAIGLREAGRTHYGSDRFRRGNRKRPSITPAVH